MLSIFWDFAGLWRKLPGMGPNGAGRIFVPTHPDLVDILGRTDLNFDIFYFFDFLDPKFLDFQVPRVPDFQKSGLGQAWARLGAWAGLGQA